MFMDIGQKIDEITRAASPELFTSKVSSVYRNLARELTLIASYTTYIVVLPLIMPARVRTSMAFIFNGTSS